ncbi:MAG TPA: glycosyltransferase family 2 protein [Gemmataceae bacterium]
MTAPPLSVVIPSHRRADLLERCLRSVTRHAPAGTEILVIDDGSPGAAASETARRFPGVGAHRLARNRGFCAAANRGIALARAPVVEMLNDDAEVTPGWAEAALRWFADPSVAAVAPLVLQGPPGSGGPPRIDSAGDGYDLGGFARKLGHGRPLGPEYLRGGFVFGASASSAFYRAEALRRVGSFPESFGAYFEDVDLSFRLNRAGYRVRYEPASVVWHRVSASHGRTSRRLLQQQSCNEERVFWRNVPRELLPRALPRHLAVLAGKALRRWGEGALLPFVWGRLRAWAGWRDILRHRAWLAGLCRAGEGGGRPGCGISGWPGKGEVQ